MPVKHNKELKVLVELRVKLLSNTVTGKINVCRIEILGYELVISRYKIDFSKKENNKEEIKEEV